MNVHDGKVSVRVDESQIIFTVTDLPVALFDVVKVMLPVRDTDWTPAPLKSIFVVAPYVRVDWPIRMLFSDDCPVAFSFITPRVPVVLSYDILVDNPIVVDPEA